MKTSYNWYHFQTPTGRVAIELDNIDYYEEVKVPGNSSYIFTKSGRNIQVTATFDQIVELLLQKPTSSNA